MSLSHFLNTDSAYPTDVGVGYSGKPRESPLFWMNPQPEETNSPTHSWDIHHQCWIKSAQLSIWIDFRWKIFRQTLFASSTLSSSCRFLKLGPSLFQFVSTVSLLLNNGNPIFEPVCFFFTLFSSAFAFLVEMGLSFESLLAIWSFSPQRFHYYLNLSIVSWHYHKYWTILILVLCLLCVPPLVCSFYSSFALLIF